MPSSRRNTRRTIVPGIPDDLRTQRLRTLNCAVDEAHYHDAADELRYRLLKPIIDKTLAQLALEVLRLGIVEPVPIDLPEDLIVLRLVVGNGAGELVVDDPAAGVYLILVRRLI